ncbi:DUF6335 family protein [Thermocoleostomius sinensis]|uniref:DUF6335 family protein n=1 Tax=Thermocoleostomius sinensis A174 TaxID=2016057 RepID=A0A9E8ZHX6_9CYAN|nr:DUF6335 family protein [Thermocoleostomius sinensis]WAL62129.1 DUF6335 family protein [Thermocoleostomius sinensis A174]
MDSKNRSSKNQSTEGAQRTTNQSTNLEQDILGTVAVDELVNSAEVEAGSAFEEPEDDKNVDDRSQASNISYGTGVQGKPTDRAGRYSRHSNAPFADDSDSVLTGGDIDANYEEASAVGDEAVGGTAATPDQDIVENLAAAAGVELDDRTDVRINDLLEERDDRRWELNPESAEDYEQHQE